MPAIRLAVGELPDQSSSVDPRAEALKSAVATYERVLIAYAFGLLHEWELSRDVVQDTFMKLHRELKSGEPANLKAWLFTVCRNRSLDVLRKEKRVTVTDTQLLEIEGDEGVNGPDVLTERQDSHERAMQLMERLPENQQEVIRLKFLGDLSYKEISEITGLSVGNVGYLLHHGLKRLRELMQEPFD